MLRQDNIYMTSFQLYGGGVGGSFLLGHILVSPLKASSPLGSFSHFGGQLMDTEANRLERCQRNTQEGHNPVRGQVEQSIPQLTLLSTRAGIQPLRWHLPQLTDLRVRRNRNKQTREQSHSGQTGAGESTDSYYTIKYFNKRVSLASKCQY